MIDTGELMSKVILVTGATGRQGGAVIDSILALEADFSIIAVTRNPSSPSAQRLALRSPNVKVIQGDLDDAEGIFEAAKQASSNNPVWGVYSVQVCHRMQICLL